MVWVFVYGTLLVGELNHHVALPYLLRVEPGAVRGKLYDFGPYPGLVAQDDGDLIQGEWFQVTSEGLKHMDALEEYYGPGETNDYDRIWIRDVLREGREGYVYVWKDSRGCPPISGGCWRSRTLPG